MHCFWLNFERCIQLARSNLHRIWILYHCLLPPISRHRNRKPHTTSFIKAYICNPKNLVCLSLASCIIRDISSSLNFSKESSRGYCSFSSSEGDPYADVGIPVRLWCVFRLENIHRGQLDCTPPTPSGTTLPDRNHLMLISLISNVVINGMVSHTLTSSLRSASFSSSTALSTTRPTTTLTTACPGLIN